MSEKTVIPQAFLLDNGYLTKIRAAAAGELHYALDRDVLKDSSEAIELGQLTSKKVIGRDNNEQIAVCDLTGTGVQDTAIALVAYQELLKQPIGMEIDNQEL
ncbi:hypothetical protein [Planococcus sp. CPCC 101016]|uniref:hypothetical protein n=1 Tax=Planococcus sp. CPCC 101016 TaxID=2599617 RepID=UPI0021BD014F|nr:hypothetical protein [Planococcus sp. CPCC 101016]